MANGNSSALTVLPCALHLHRQQLIVFSDQISNKIESCCFQFLNWNGIKAWLICTSLLVLPIEINSVTW